GAVPPGTPIRSARPGRSRPSRDAAAGPRRPQRRTHRSPRSAESVTAQFCGGRAGAAGGRAGVNPAGSQVIWLRTCGRALNTVFFAFTAVYCILTFSPFAYEQFIQPHVIAWLANFVFLYAYFYWLALCVTVLTLVPLMKLRVAPLAWAYFA